MGICRYRDAETGELIDGPTADREYVIERPVDWDESGRPKWPDELPVVVSMSQPEAKKLYEKIKNNPQLSNLTQSLKVQIWEYSKKNYL